jgi:hypothetical protein
MLNKLTKILYWVLITLALLGLASQLYPALTDYYQSAKIALSYPYSLDYGEGPLLDQTLRMAKFENIYRSSLDKPPYTISNYPPLFPLVQVPFAWLFGPAFWYGRAISILGVLLTALFICLTLHTLTHDWIASVIAGLLLVAFPYVQHWSMFNRIDELALVLSWAALFVIVRYVGRTPAELSSAFTSRRGALLAQSKTIFADRFFWLATVLFVAAIYTRQTYALAAPFAAFFWLIFGALGSWKSRFLRAILLGVAVGGITLVLFLIFNLATAGGFYLNIVVSNVNTFYWKTVWNYLDKFVDKLWPLLALIAGFFVLEAIEGIVKLIIWFINRRNKKAQPVTVQKGSPWRRTSWALVLPYLLASAAGSITIGKDGSNVNYLLELSAAVSLAAGAALAWAWQWKRWYVRIFIQCALIGVLAYQSGIMIDWTRKDYNRHLEDRMTHLADITALAQLVKQSPGIVLVDEYMGLVPLAGKQLYLQPFEFKQLVDAKVWDQEPLLIEIMNKKFDLILWYRPSSWLESIESRWSAGQRSMVNIAYDLDQRIGDVYIYRPKK